MTCFGCSRTFRVTTEARNSKCNSVPPSGLVNFALVRMSLLPALCAKSWTARLRERWRRLTAGDARARPSGGHAEGRVSGSGHERDAVIDTALLGCIQKIQEYLQGDFVVGMSKGGALNTDGTKAFSQKAEDRYRQPVGHYQSIQVVGAWRAGEAAKRRGAGR